MENAMNDCKINVGILIFFLMSSILFLDGCKEPVDLKSRWLDKEIVIDADDNDWQDYPLFYDEKTRSCIGVYNDDANLYLCFQTMDEDIQRQILSQGLFVWFNSTGGKDKQFGVCFPTGRRSYGLGGFPGRPPDMTGPPPEGSSDMSGASADKPSGDRNTLPGRPFGGDSDTDEKIRLFTSEKVKGWPYTVQEAANLGIFARYTVDQRKRFIYELKIHLAESGEATYATVVSAADKIGRGFMTARSANMPGAGGMGREGRGGGDTRGGGRPGGGMPGGGMPGGGMGGGDMPGGGTGRSKDSLEIWTNVTLASNPFNNK
jgi:hypothetical protein